MKYRVMLNGELLAKTDFEFADSPMGIVFGKVVGVNKIINYEFLKELTDHNIAELVSDYPEDKLISIRSIKNCVVINENGEVISEDNNMIEGMDSDYYTLTIGLSYPKYEDEFPHHVNNYKNAFN